MRRFYGFRPNPPSEYKDKNLTNAGASPDYEGVFFEETTGKVVLQWRTGYKSMTIYESWEDFWRITGHPEYGTKLKWLDGETD